MLTARRRATVVLSLALAASAGGGVLAMVHPSSLPAAHAATTTRRLYWVAIGSNPTEAQLQAAVGKYDTLILNSDCTRAAERMRQLDPQVKILMYMDLSGVRVYDGSKTVVTGVSYDTARAKGWVAKDVIGADVAWNGYSGHLLATPWDAGYRDAWTATVVAKAKTSVWDGVYADNDMSSLGYYSPQLLAGTSSRAATDAKIRAGVDALVAQVGPALNAAGRSLVVNISDGRLDLAHWDAHAKYGGGMEENFLSWSMTDGKPNVYDWGNTGWTTQTSLMARGPKSLAVTNAAPGDMRTLLYGYASFLMTAQDGDAWTGRDSSGYNTAKLPPETNIALGPAQGPAWQENGVWLRSYAWGLVIVNPQKIAKTYTPTSSAVDSKGQWPGQITLPEMTARVLRWK